MGHPVEYIHTKFLADVVYQCLDILKTRPNKNICYNKDVDKEITSVGWPICGRTELEVPRDVETKGGGEISVSE